MYSFSAAEGALKRAITKYGAAVRFYKHGRLVAKTKAVINLERSKNSAGHLTYKKFSRVPLGVRRSSNIILFVPASSIFDGDDPLTVLCRDVMYQVDATADVPFIGGTLYTWCLCSPLFAAVDDFDDYDGGAA